MKTLLISFTIAVAAIAEAGAAEYICRLPNGKTSIQGTPCSHDAKTAYQNTRRYETQEEMQERVLDADRRINEPRRRELAIQEAERDESRRRQQEEDERQAMIAREQQRAAMAQAREQAIAAREQAILDEMRRTREAADAAQAAAARAARSASAPTQSSRRMTCFRNGPITTCD